MPEGFRLLHDDAAGPAEVRGGGRVDCGQGRISPWGTSAHRWTINGMANVLYNT